MQHVEKKKPCQKTLKKCAYNIPQFTAFTTEQLMDVLPQNFSLQEENNQLMLIIESSAQFSEEQIFYELQRECDLIFFLTGEQFKPMLIYKENPDGSKRVENECEFILRGIEKLPLDIDRQQWTHKLSLQLRLWQLAHLPYLPVSVQIALLFQIIESSFPDTRNKQMYPLFEENNLVPHPRTETKLIRDWVSHQVAKMRKRLCRYCKYLDIEPRFFDPTDAEHQRKIPGLLEKVEREAENVINDSITRRIIDKK